LKVFSGKNTIYDDEMQVVLPDWKTYIAMIVERVLANPSGDA
jgi:hypothetical protein